MPPSSSQEPPLAQLKYCAIAPHRLKQPSRKINDPNVHRFAKRINSEIRLGSSMCLICYKKLMQIYRMKMANAQRHVDKQKSSANSVSDLSSSQQMDSSSDPSIVNPPQMGGVTMRKKAPIRTPVSSPSSSTSNDDRPSTSIATAAKRKRTSGEAPPPASEPASEPSTPPATPSAPAVVNRTSYISDDDDPNSNLSLNAVNGTRLPHIQPIPKRRQFVHLNKVAMDIYLAGTTGG